MVRKTKMKKTPHLARKSIVTTRLAAVTILTVSVVAATAVVVQTTSDTTGAPAAPALVGLKRPVTMRWTRVPGATSYRIWRDGVVVKTVTGLQATVFISCTGNTPHRLNVQAQNSSGKSPMKTPVWRTC
jgi:hypothetical protein